ncbi:MAG: hypothetical protein SWX82_01485 [Cyanobacteriota bacterium]|nr:hypothetical protein [Cyanobacteriota bacterium]
MIKNITKYSTCLGFGQEERSSGQIESFSSSGSAIAKSELYNWSRTSVGKKRLISQVGLEIQAKFDEYYAKNNIRSQIHSVKHQKKSTIETLLHKLIARCSYRTCSFCEAPRKLQVFPLASAKKS